MTRALTSVEVAAVKKMVDSTLWGSAHMREHLDLIFEQWSDPVLYVDERVERTAGSRSFSAYINLAFIIEDVMDAWLGWDRVVLEIMDQTHASREVAEAAYPLPKHVWVTWQVKDLEVAGRS